MVVVLWCLLSIESKHHSTTTTFSEKVVDVLWCLLIGTPCICTNLGNFCSFLTRFISKQINSFIHFFYSIVSSSKGFKMNKKVLLFGILLSIGLLLIIIISVVLALVLPSGKKVLHLRIRMCCSKVLSINW